MKLVETITLGRITREEQLNLPDRLRVRHAPGLAWLIKENRALGQVAEHCQPTPDWSNLRADVYGRAAQLSLAPWAKFRHALLASPRWAMAGMSAMALFVILTLALALTVNPTGGGGEISFSAENPRAQTSYASYQTVRYP